MTSNGRLLLYLDDIVVFSSSFDTHLEDHSVVCKRLNKVGLKLKPKNFNLFAKEVTILGYIVSRKGMLCGI